jgi:hypothetical protein
MASVPAVTFTAPPFENPRPPVIPCDPATPMLSVPRFVIEPLPV